MRIHATIVTSAALSTLAFGCASSQPASTTAGLAHAEMRARAHAPQAHLFAIGDSVGATLMRSPALQPTGVSPVFALQTKHGIIAGDAIGTLLLGAGGQPAVATVDDDDDE